MTKLNSWEKTFFKVIYIRYKEYKGIYDKKNLKIKEYYLDINTYYIKDVISDPNYKNHFEDFSINFDHWNSLSYSKKINFLEKNVHKITKIILRKIGRLKGKGRFKYLKYDKKNKYFIISKRNMDRYFYHNENSGNVYFFNDEFSNKKMPTNKNIFQRILLKSFFRIIKRKNDKLSKHDKYFNNFLQNKKIRSTNNLGIIKEFQENTNSDNLPNFEKFIDIKFLKITSGLSVVGIVELSDKKNIGFIFDLGSFASGKDLIASKVIKYFDSKKDLINNDKIFAILTHDHFDHYSIYKTQIFKDWISKQNSTIMFYHDLSSSSKLEAISSFKNKINLTRENKTIILGKAVLKIFYEKEPVPSAKQNYTAMIMKLNNIVLTSDQYYKNIPDSWKSNNNIFQVPHHGSKLNGSYSECKNNSKSFIPDGKRWKIPSIEVLNWFKKNSDENFLIDSDDENILL